MDIRRIDIRPFRHNISLYDDCIIAFRPSALHSLFGGLQVSPLRSTNFALALRIVFLFGIEFMVVRAIIKERAGRISPTYLYDVRI